MELDLVISSKQSAFQCAIRQAVREEQLIKNHMVLEHIRVLDRWKTEDLFIAKHRSCSGSSRQQEEKIGVDMMVNYKKKLLMQQTFHFIHKLEFCYKQYLSI